MAGTTRRGFLQQGMLLGGSLALGGQALQGRAWAKVGPAEVLNLGIIGVGWRGGQLIEAFQQVPGVKIVAICDPDSALLEPWAEKLPGVQKFTDLRELLDQPAIDAVAIATCNHWHCLAALWAMEAGKHVYVEKPLSNTLWEGEQVVQGAAKYQKVCQVGTQQRSSPMQAEIKRILHDTQELGPLEWVRVNRYGVRETIGKRDTPLAPPTTLDYNLWLGPAVDQPIYRDKWHYDWHWDWNTGAGEMGNWGVHIMDDVRNNVFRDEIAFPQRVLSAGGRFAWHDAGDTPNVHFGLLDTGSIPVVVALTNLPNNPGSTTPPDRPGPGSGYIAYCEGGRLEGVRGKAWLFDKAGKMIREIEDVDGMVLHQKNFVDAVRNNTPQSLTAPAKVGHHSTAWCNLINYAYRSAAESSQPGDIRALASQLSTGLQGNGAGMTAAVDTILAELSAAAQLNEGRPVDMAVGPLLTVDPSSGQFVGDGAEIANRFTRSEGRGEFVVKPVTAAGVTLPQAAG